MTDSMNAARRRHSGVTGAMANTGGSLIHVDDDVCALYDVREQRYGFTLVYIIENAV